MHKTLKIDEDRCYETMSFVIFYLLISDLYFEHECIPKWLFVLTDSTDITVPKQNEIWPCRTYLSNILKYSKLEQVVKEQMWGYHCFWCSVKKRLKMGKLISSSWML